MWVPGEHRTQDPILAARSMVRLWPSWVSSPMMTKERSRVWCPITVSIPIGPRIHDYASAQDDTWPDEGLRAGARVGVPDRVALLGLADDDVLFH